MSGKACPAPTYQLLTLNRRWSRKAWQCIIEDKRRVKSSPTWTIFCSLWVTKSLFRVKFSAFPSVPPLFPSFPLPVYPSASGSSATRHVPRALNTQKMRLRGCAQTSAANALSVYLKAHGTCLVAANVVPFLLNNYWRKRCWMYCMLPCSRFFKFYAIISNISFPGGGYHQKTPPVTIMLGVLQIQVSVSPSLDSWFTVLVGLAVR